MTAPDRPRPRDWAPLSAADPLPGNPAAIAAEAKRLKDLGVEMRAQITRLRQIGNDSTLIGQYAEKLRTAATDLAGKLDKAVGRYEQVSGHLSMWGPDLARHQATTVEALEKAKAAEEIRIKNATAAIPLGAPIAVPPTVEEVAAARAAQCAVDDADCMLRQARDQMQTAVEEARSRGREIADLIDDATDDDVKDSRWDRFKSWVDRNAGWIKAVSDVLSAVATVLALVAIVVVLVVGSAIPGLNLILWLTVGAAVGHGLLAVSGNGSWADFGLDIFALATFGAGRLVTGGLKGASAATRIAGARAARKAATDASLLASRPGRQAASRVLTNPSSSPGARRAARAFIDHAHREAYRAGNLAARAVRNEPLPAVMGKEAFSAGDLEASRWSHHALGLRSRFVADPGVQEASRNVELWSNIGEAAFVAGIGVDGADKVAEGAHWEDYDRAKAGFTREWGSTW